MAVNSDPALCERLTGGIKAALDELMLAGETVEASLNGLTGQAIALTNRRVIIIKAGLASGAMFGHKAKGYPLDQITSVEFSCALTEGRVQLTVAGVLEQQHGWMSRRTFIDEVASSRQAENLCQFYTKQKKLFRTMAQLVQARADAARAAARQPSVVAATAPSIPEQIKQLKELADVGALTQDEYERKKRDLLARM